ncbi:hypothetical protein DM860_012485 [Cuscuta australis]|uniref:Uncharacterized protein n=1 Tax=Cuscuta australis TaxID=267555 RepID=A0A328DCU6_9ASTE|nr:hypothetical protein DM860_012485 [Cuscuta australis]
MSVLTLSELKGRADALLLSGGKGKGKLRTSFSHSDPISNAFNGFKQRNHGYTLVQIFMSVAPYPSMHDDICTVALEKGANIVIVFLNKQVSYQGATGVNFPAIRIVNQNVLQKAPCSIGVLIDRGKVSEYTSIHLGYNMFCVTTLFFGGADDREALAYSSRIADHPGVDFSLVWIRNLRDKKLEEPEKSKDLEMVDKFQAMKDRIGFKEEVVIDTVDTMRVLRSLRGNCDLCIVGRYHVFGVGGAAAAAGEGV